MIWRRDFFSACDYSTGTISSETGRVAIASGSDRAPTISGSGRPKKVKAKKELNYLISDTVHLEMKRDII